MNDPKPVIPPAPAPEPGALPSNATIGSGIGGALAVLVVMMFHAKGIDFPAGGEAALAVVISTLAGYLPKAGRK